jgi:hypothetical protein
MTRRDWLGSLAMAQLPPEPPESEPEFLCPMDKDVRSKTPGKCPRCGMALIAGLPDPLEYPVALQVTPRRIKPGQPFDLRFRVLDPKNRQKDAPLEIVHEKLFHLFLISQDLDYFAHEHPELQKDGSFVFRASLPKGGLYRLACDFYPTGNVPQMAVKTLIVPGAPIAKAKLTADMSPRQAGGLGFTLATDPVTPIAGKKTLLFFEIAGATKLEPFLASWAHMMIASSDLADLLHLHPVIADGGPKMQFNIIFPRAGVYRLWLQIQNAGQVVTVPFDIPVKVLS